MSGMLWILGSYFSPPYFALAITDMLIFISPVYKTFFQTSWQTGNLAIMFLWLTSVLHLAV